MKHILTLFIACACLTVWAEWPTYHGGYDLAGYADMDFPAEPEQKWKFRADSEVVLAPVVGNSLIFFVSGKGTLYALDLECKEKWKREAIKGESFSGSPAYAGGMLALASDDGAVYLFDANTGKRKWTHNIDDESIGSSPNWYKVSGGFHLAVMTAPTGIAYCLDSKKGKLIRKLDETTRTDGAIAIASDSLVFGSCDSALHVFSAATGQKKAKVELGSSGQVPAAPAISGGLAFSGTYGEGLASVDIKEMKVKWWNRDTDESISVTPAVDDNNVVFASESGTVYCADKQSGKTRWKFDTDGMPSGVIIIKDKIAVVADGKLFLLKLNDGILLWSKEIGDEASPPSVANDMLIIGSDDGNIRAFGGKK